MRAQHCGALLALGACSGMSWRGKVRIPARAASLLDLFPSSFQSTCAAWGPAWPAPGPRCSLTPKSELSDIALGDSVSWSDMLASALGWSAAAGGGGHWWLETLQRMAASSPQAPCE